MFDPSKLGEMLQQARQMQDRLQTNLSSRQVVGEAGGGLVQITMNGLLQVLAVKIDPSAIDAKDRTLLEDLVRSAVQQAIQGAEAARMEETRQIAGGLGIPGL